MCVYVYTCVYIYIYIYIYIYSHSSSSLLDLHLLRAPPFLVAVRAVCIINISFKHTLYCIALSCLGRRVCGTFGCAGSVCLA